MSIAFPASPRAVSRRSVSIISAYTSEILRQRRLTAVAKIALDGIKMGSLLDPEVSLVRPARRNARVRLPRR